MLGEVIGEAEKRPNYFNIAMDARQTGCNYATTRGDQKETPEEFGYCPNLKSFWHEVCLNSEERKHWENMSRSSCAISA